MFKIVIALICLVSIGLMAEVLANRDSDKNPTDTLANLSSTNKTIQKEFHSTALFVNVLGTAGYYTINYEHRFNDVIALSGGVGADVGINVNSSLNFLFGSSRHKLEPQLGVAFSHYYYQQLASCNSGEWHFFSAIGYRYQAKNGFLFRFFSGIGYDYLAYSSQNYHYASPYIPIGLSFGYCFK